MTYAYHSASLFHPAKPAPGYVTDSTTGQRDVSWRLLPANFLDDQRAMWLFPVQLAHGHHWLPTISIIGLMAGLIVADPHDTPYFVVPELRSTLIAVSAR